MAVEKKGVRKTERKACGGKDELRSKTGERVKQKESFECGKEDKPDSSARLQGWQHTRVNHHTAAIDSEIGCGRKRCSVHLWRSRIQ